MRTLQVVDGVDDDGALSQTSDSWAVMVPLPRLELPRRPRYGEIPHLCSHRQPLQRRDGDPSTSHSQHSSLSEEDDGEEEASWPTSAEVSDSSYSANADRGSAASFIAGGCLCDVASSSSSCETPKGEPFGIREPLSPPSPPRKRKAPAASRTRSRGVPSFFYPPDDFELLFCPLASSAYM